MDYRHMTTENPNSVRFGLLLEKSQNTDGSTSFNINTSNTGIPDTEVIIYLEAWLEKFKDHVKGPIKESIVFFNNNDDE